MAAGEEQECGDVECSVQRVLGLLGQIHISSHSFCSRHAESVRILHWSCSITPSYL